MHFQVPSRDHTQWLSLCLWARRVGEIKITLSECWRKKVFLFSSSCTFLAFLIWEIKAEEKVYEKLNQRILHSHLQWHIVEIMYNTISEWYEPQQYCDIIQTCAPVQCAHVYGGQSFHCGERQLLVLTPLMCDYFWMIRHRLSYLSWCSVRQAAKWERVKHTSPASLLCRWWSGGRRRSHWDWRWMAQSGIRQALARGTPSRHVSSCRF